MLVILITIKMKLANMTATTTLQTHTPCLREPLESGKAAQRSQPHETHHHHDYAHQVRAHPPVCVTHRLSTCSSCPLMHSSILTSFLRWIVVTMHESTIAIPLPTHTLPDRRTCTQASTSDPNHSARPLPLCQSPGNPLALPRASSLQSQHDCRSNQ